jgi:hypothetical protein
VGRSLGRGVTWVVLLGLALFWAAPARATEDAAVSEIVKQVLDGDYADGNFVTARRKLLAALDRCRTGRCNGQTRAQAHVALGMIASQLGNRPEAIGEFQQAVREDSNAKLPENGASPSIRNAWDEVTHAAAPAAAQGAAPGTQSTAPPPPTPVPAPVVAPLATPPPAPQPAPLAAPPPEKPKVFAGWQSAEAFELAAGAVAADQVGKLDECISKNQASLKLEEQPRTRLHLASCETRTGHLIDALTDAQKALRAGIDRRDAPVMRAARQRIGDLLQRIPHVTFLPPGADDLTVTFDDRPVPTESLTKKFSVDPGKHRVHAEGLLNGIPLAFDKEYDLKEAQLLTVQIVLATQAPEYLTPGQLKCMLSAKSQDDVLKCLPQGRRPLVVKAGFDMSGYTDTNHVDVVTPAINGSVSSPTQGWNVGGTYLIDIVTAASPDIVSEASRHFREVRNAGTLTGGYKPGPYGAQATADLGSEPDYLSYGGGIALTADLRDKLVSPRFAYNYHHDTIGRAGTPFSVFHNTLVTNEFEAGVTLVLSATSILVASLTAQFERGDQSKPYRYVPMFEPLNIAPRIPVGASVDLVNQVRLPIRPLEQLPTERDRYAIGARFAHRFTGTVLPSATLRVEQRIYHDSWALNATTTDARYVMDLGRRVRAWPHLRFNAQTGTNFYQLAYSALVNPDGTVIVPTYRTGDRELSPLVTATFGGGGRLALTAPEAKTQYGISAQADLMYTRFLNSLFVTTRTAVYGTVGFDAEFQ